MLTGLLFAVCAAVLNCVAGLLQSSGAARAAVRSARPLIVQPHYLVGLVVDGVGWIATVVALRHLPVFAVQAILGTSIALTALAVRLLYDIRLRVVDRIAIGACVLGLGLVAGSAGAEQPEALTLVADVVLASAALGLAVLTVALWNTQFVWALAMIAGLGFGGTSLAVRALHLRDGFDLAGLLGQLPTYLLIAFWALAMAAYSHALQVGELASITAVFSVTEVIVPGLVGIVLLGDAVRPGWLLPLGAGLLVAVAGVVVLAGSPATARAGAQMRARHRH